MKVMVVFDETIHSKIALRYAIYKTQQTEDRLLLINITDSHSLLYYEATPFVREIIKRDIKRNLQEADKIISELSHSDKTTIIEAEGDYTNILNKNILLHQVEIVYAPASFRKKIQQVSCPISFIPGHILVPIDDDPSQADFVENLINEALLSLSDVIILGLIPIHIYGKTEQEELNRIRTKTLDIMKTISKGLTKAKIKYRELVREGYPDEEIMKVYKEGNVSMIYFLSSLQRSLELKKAVSLLTDEKNKLISPIMMINPLNNLPTYLSI